MKKNKLNIKKILVIGIVIIIAIILFLVLKNIFNNKAKEKTNLVINNNNVTSRLKKDVIIEDDVIYLSKQDIQNFFDKYIYEDEQYNQIITTSDKNKWCKKTNISYCKKRRRHNIFTNIRNA
jgi:hypothetical protein